MEPKTIFCDIDGTLLPHRGDILQNTMPTDALPNVADTIRSWDRANHRIILTTGRKESTRAQTEHQLQASGIVYDDLIMGLPNGDRIVINDKKTNGVRNTAYAINLPRNGGLQNVDVLSKNVTIPDKYLFTKVEKPWGYEELIECNDKYVLKRLFMKEGHACSLQYHELKRETILVLSGSLSIRVGDESRVYKPGETVTIPPHTIHQMKALEDSLYCEASSNELWDVVRIKDDYGRS